MSMLIALLQYFWELIGKRQLKRKKLVLYQHNSAIYMQIYHEQF